MISIVGIRYRNYTITPYVGVVFSFMGSLALDCYHFYFLMILNQNANISVTMKSGSTVVFRYSIQFWLRSLVLHILD